MAGVVIALLLVAGVGGILYMKRCDWFNMCLGVPLDPAKDTVITPDMTVPASVSGVKHHATGKGKSGGGTVPTTPATTTSSPQSTGVSQQGAAFARTLSQHGYRLSI